MSTNTAKKETVQAMTVAPEPASDVSALMILVQRAALDPNFDVGKLQALMEMKERWDANEARKAYVAAMAEFKANPPEILKRKLVEYKDASGNVGTSYMHAELADVTAAVIQPLAQAGFSHAWATKQLEGGMIEVSCTLTHRLGHSESTTLKSGADQSGKKNNIQAIASTVTYLERYTLLMATGLATKGIDDDARSSEAPPIDTKAADWIALFESLPDTTTPEDFKTRKGELVKAYGSVESMVPKAVVSAYNAAKARVREASK